MRALAPFVVLLGLLAASQAARGEDEGESLVVGTKEAPPFAMRAEDGSWRGIGVELWREIARELDLPHEFEEVTLDELVDGVAEGRLDASVAALTVTPEREDRVDFTHAFFTTGLGIATRPGGDGGLGGALAGVFSSGFFRTVLVLAGVLLLAGTLLWLFERRKNAAQFGGGPVKGLGAAFWWSAVTMTTVGYGDKAPVSLGGRLVAIVWMFASLILVAGFTAALASALTVSNLEGSIQGPEDLPGKRVGTVPDSTSERYLRRHRIARRAYPDPAAALRGLAGGEVDAVVYDHPVLAWLVGHDEGFGVSLEVLPRTFERQDYAIALPSGSPRREAVNRVLLRKIDEPSWEETLSRYLGRQE